MNNIKKNVLAVISGPSGVGKGTVIKKMFELCPGLCESVSCTTRAPRAGEVDGKDYFFIPKERFEQMISRGELLEYSAHFENYYGTPKAFVEEKLKTCDVILEIDVDGTLMVKKSHPSAVLIMITPPDMRELENRLKKRGTESDEKIALRISRAEYELSKSDKYDYCVVNDDVTRAAESILAIIRKEKEVLND